MLCKKASEALLVRETVKQLPRPAFEDAKHTLVSSKAAKLSS